ncbi:hypothetical protein GIB67_012647 [Kingdonia uniflora]|uniref:Uncharacterized protein n=1 Tax=Kingdonia uniflora TaxID=39325 RepID=A0A7J7NFH5_9MAGN|nr:hypothetical protein GIB67_012647 [Kingdonia uniflora]
METSTSSRLIEDVHVEIDNVDFVGGELRIESSKVVELEVEGKGELVFLDFPGNFLPYPADSDVFKEFYKIKKLKRGVDESISLEYFNGGIQSDLDQRYLCYLSQLEFRLMVPLNNLAKGILNTIEDYPTQLNDVRLLNGIHLGLEDRMTELKKRVAELEKRVVQLEANLALEKERSSSVKDSHWVTMLKLAEEAKKNAEEVLVARDNLGQKLLDVGHSLSNIEAIIEGRYVDEADAEEEPEVEGGSPQGVVKGSDAVSANTDLENREGESEKELKGLRLRIEDLEKELAKEQNSSATLLTSHMELQAELKVVRASEEYAMECNYEFKLNFEKIKEASKNNADQYAKLKIKLVQAERIVNELTQRIESRDAKNEKLQGEHVTVQNNIASEHLRWKLKYCEITLPV